MVLKNSARGPSYSTDPVAAMVRASMTPAVMHHHEPAERSGPAMALDIDRLYPNLAAEQPQKRLRKRAAVSPAASP
jgi:hypothetical protein